ncbi:MAG: DAK2 domain-containing protein [Anaerolineae bacterium]|nr:DAK2 domain-containing protein [Anaerolineae bacterium]
MAETPAVQESTGLEDGAEVGGGSVAAQAEPLLQCDGPTLKAWVQAALGWLEEHAKAINALNVFPVPDGDTGTNMLLTLRSAWKEASNASEKGVGQVAHALAYGALMGARGNSGVILSQLLRGFARRLEGLETFGVGHFAEALKEASLTAYKGVIKPVEGTILTVSKDIAAAAEAAARETDDLRVALERVMAAARESVERTPSLLPVLAEAGVVDAGGKGLAIILEGMFRHLKGEQTAPGSPAAEPAPRVAAGTPGEQGYGYDIQFILQGQGLDLLRVREDISAMGDSVLVVGDERTIKVHLHSPDPGRPLSYAARLGTVTDVVVESLEQQVAEFTGPAEVQSPTQEPETGIGLVVVARGEGMIQVFQSLGATAIVPGGQTMNPSTEELLQAIESQRADDVIVLPNNANVLLAAQQTQALSKKNVRVVPSRTLPQGIAALLAFNYQADLDTNVEIMTEGMEHVRTGEVTIAVREARVNGVRVQEGQVIGLLDGELATAGATYEEVIHDLLQRMEADQAEILTIYYGEGVTEDEARRIGDLVRKWFPGQDVELVAGGQPHYPFILSAE